METEIYSKHPSCSFLDIFRILIKSETKIRVILSNHIPQIVGADNMKLFEIVFKNKQNNNRDQFEHELELACQYKMIEID